MNLTTMVEAITNAAHAIEKCATRWATTANDAARAHIAITDERESLKRVHAAQEECLRIATDVERLRFESERLRLEVEKSSHVEVYARVFGKPSEDK